MPENKNVDATQEAVVTRRNLFQILGSVPAVAALASQASAQTHDEHMHAAATAKGQPQGPYKRQIFLEDHQWKTVHLLSDLIIPADDRSGSAADAGVPEFIDDWIAFRNSEDGHRNLEARVVGGLTWLDMESNRLFEKDFVDAAAPQQKQLLDRIAWPDKAAKEDHAWVLFFNTFRDLVVSGFFSSKMGVKDLQYMGNTAILKWEGCPANVWAIIEERMKKGYKGVAIQESKPWGA